MKKRLRILFDRTKIETVEVSDETANASAENKNQFFAVPYVRSVSESFKITLQDRFHLAYVGQNNLGRYVRALKDPLPKSSNSDVVYKINCKDCNASYVGHTGRKLCTRMKEHQRSGAGIVVGEHRISNDHDFDWEGVKILDTERSWHKRLISETIHIKKQTQSINAQNDTLLLDDIYLPIIKKLK